MKDENMKDVILWAFIYIFQIHYNFMVKIFKIKQGSAICGLFIDLSCLYFI